LSLRHLDACPVARLKSPDRATGRDRVLTDTVRRLLSSVTIDALCDACLAAACATSLREMRVDTETLVSSRRRIPSCVFMRELRPNGAHDRLPR